MNLASIKSALAKYSQVSMLGSLGQGTATTTPNFAVGSNGVIIPAAQSNLFQIVNFTAKITGRILLIATMTNAASAVDDIVEYQTTVDGAPTPGGTGGGFLESAAGHVTATVGGTVVWIESVTVGTTHSYGILGTNTTGGHTVATPQGGATVAIYELP